MAWNNLSDPIFEHAAQRAAAPALIEGHETLDYRGLAALVGKASVYLRDRGIGEGDRIGVALTNSIDHVVLMVALWRVGAALVELSVTDNAETLAATAAKYDIRTIFTEADAAPLPGVTQIAVGLSWRRALAGKDDDHRSNADGDALSFLMLTTGSTGTPTAWVTTHRAFSRVAEMREAWWRASGWDAAREHANFLLVSPLRFCWFQLFAVLAFRAGATLVLLPEYAKAPDMVRAFAAWDNAVAYITANTGRYFLRVAPREGFLLANMRWLESGGLPLTGEEKRAMRACVTPRYNETYGSTGAGFITALDGHDMAAKADTVGRPPAGCELEIVDAAGRPLLNGAIGEIRCRPGWARPLDDGDAVRGSERIDGAWWYPGDIGYLDDDGFLHLKGRATDLLRREGIEVFLPEIESVIASHPNVVEAGVITMQVAEGGADIVAFVVKRAGLDHDELARFCRLRLAPERLPDRVYYIDAIPRIAGLKPDRTRLKALALVEARKISGGG